MDSTSSSMSAAVNYQGLDSSQDLDSPGSCLKLVTDVLSKIFSHLGLGGLEVAVLVNKEWRHLIVSHPANSAIREKADYQKMAIGPRDWAKFFGASAPSDEEIQAAYACLPDDMHKILNTPCPVFPKDGELVKKYGGLVKDTHVLVYIPQSVKTGEQTLTEITLRSLGALVEAKLNSDNRKVEGYDYIHPKVTLDKPIEEAHWVLMTKDVLGEGDLGLNGSRGKDYNAQEKMVKDLSERSGESYMIPQTLEAVAVLIAHLLKSGEYIFGRGDDLWTYTRCEEVLSNGCHVSVGGFAPAGLVVGRYYAFDDVGVAGLRKFFLGLR